MLPRPFLDAFNLRFSRFEARRESACLWGSEGETIKLFTTLCGPLSKKNIWLFHFNVSTPLPVCVYRSFLMFRGLLEMHVVGGSQKRKGGLNNC